MRISGWSSVVCSSDLPATYLGLQVAGFPNLFTTTGPGSPSALTNMPTSIEQHVEWIARCIEDLRRTGRRVIEPTPEAEVAWTGHVAEASQFGLVNHADSWYLDRKSTRLNSSH